MGNERASDFAVKVSKVLEADVAVIGGGMAGVAAALSAAQAGADVVLVERYGFLGGTATAGLISSFQAGPDVDGEPVIRGIYAQLCRRLRDAGGMAGRQRFDPESLKLILFDWCAQEGVRLLLHSFFCDAHVDEQGWIDRILLAGKGGPCQIEATLFVDATGDGDLAASAGAPFEHGRELDGRAQPMTLEFELGNVDVDAVERADLGALWDQFVAETGVTTSRGKIMPRRAAVPGKLVFNMTHVNGYSGLDGQDLAQAEYLGRQQALAILRFFRQWVPGCQNAVFASTAPQIGVRETRRILGDYIMTRKDILEARHQPDAIGRSTSWIDVHSPLGVGVLHEYVPANQWFDIPYRALLPRGIQNLLAAGRCMSATHEALGALREMPTCCVTGEAAGLAAALCARTLSETRELDLEMLQVELVARGALPGDIPLRERDKPSKAVSQEREQLSPALVPLLDLLDEARLHWHAAAQAMPHRPDEAQMTVRASRGQGNDTVFEIRLGLPAARQALAAMTPRELGQFQARGINLEETLDIAEHLHSVTNHLLVDYQEVTDRFLIYVTSGDRTRALGTGEEP